MLRLSVLFSLLFMTLIKAQSVEEFPFIGVTIETHSIDIKSGTNIPKQKETTFAIRYGKQTLDWRTMFTLSMNNNYQTFAIEIDKILLDSMFGMPELRPYLGMSVGYIRYNAIDNNDDEGLFYGANTGFIIYLTDNIDADISYHYYIIDSMEPFYNIQGASLGIHFFY